MTAAAPLTANAFGDARPTLAQAFSVGCRLLAPERSQLIVKLRQSLRAEVRAMAEQIEAEMNADGIYLTEAEIDAEVQAVRAEMHAEGQQR